GRRADCADRTCSFLRRALACPKAFAMRSRLPRRPRPGKRRKRAEYLHRTWQAPRRTAAQGNGEYLPVLFGHAPREELDLQTPVLAAVGRALADPVERVGRDLGEAPAQRGAFAARAFLHDVVAARAADLVEKGLLHRVVPEDVPGIEPRIVDAQRRTVEADLPVLGV